MLTFKQLIEDSDTRPGKIFDLFVQAMIVLSLVSFSVETLPALADETRVYLRISEVICVILFSVEYIARVLVADDKKAFILSFFGIIDLLAILPFYLSTGLDLRSLRLFRLLRLVRILKLARYSAAARRFRRAFILAREELVLFLFTALIILYLSGVGIYYFENPAQADVFSSVFHSLWWGVTTLTTVCYGDIYPITLGGKIFTFFILVIGLGVFSMPAGIVASALSKARAMED